MVRTVSTQLSWTHISQNSSPCMVWVLVVQTMNVHKIWKAEVMQKPLFSEGHCD